MRAPLYDEWGQARNDFGLADVFGVRKKAEAEGPLENSYLQIERSHPLLNGFRETTILPGPIHRVPIADVPDPILTRIPPIPAYPVEFVFPQSDRTAGSEVIVREQAGRGRVVYFCSDIDRTFWRTWNPDLGRLMQNAVRWAARNPFSAEVVGPGLFDIFYWQTEPGLALHIVNYTTPALMKGPTTAICPVGAQRIRLTLPKGVRPSQVTTLSNGKRAPFEVRETELYLTLGAIDEYEVIAFE